MCAKPARKSPYGRREPYGSRRGEWQGEPMRAFQKLVKNGNSTQITIVRPILIHLGWLPGEPVVLEVLADGSLRIYKPSLEQVAPHRMRPLFLEEPEPVKA